MPSPRATLDDRIFYFLFYFILLLLVFYLFIFSIFDAKNKIKKENLAVVESVDNSVYFCRAINGAFRARDMHASPIQNKNYTKTNQIYEISYFALCACDSTSPK